ncbi:hypothetical protein H8L32_09315 [Undibacterium sp. CY18W]|uniref:Uncharacterized protein n=1 Tax=Undibacterium hunanense TaxID=2762292 RepID=A0ABR6ZQA9_9BURK|nr:hypothetical protein [Undibacterium hunanense]MBC3917670.1 hypothetical protein [Undibacterium hunanense]
MQTAQPLNVSRSPIYFFLLFLVVLIGFYPSYFARLTQLDPKHHFHGILATGWMLMLVVQSWLASRRKIYIHRTIGKLSLVIVPLFIVSGIMIMHTMLASHGGFTKAFGSRLAFVDMTTLMGFALAYCLAIHFRTNRAVHSRWMACTALLALPPAVARLFMNFIPGIDSFPAAFHASYFSTEILAVILIANDINLKKVKTPYWMALGVLLVQHVSFLLLQQFPAWTAFTVWLGSL